MLPNEKFKQLKPIAAIAVIPAAKPSIPSIQFIALVVPTIHQIVKNKLTHGGK